MFARHSVTGRIAVGVGIGFAIGLLSIIALPSFGFPLVSMFGLGTLLVFVVMGMLTAFVGQFDRHPVFDFKMTWWLRGAVIGFSIMLMYILLSYDSLMILMQSNLVSWMGLSSPFWALIDGTLLGIIMSGFETKFASEGPELPLQ